MKLTNEDKLWLAECGHEEEDFRQIEEATNTKITKYTIDGMSISRAEVIRILGRKDYLSGIARSAFHYTACRETKGGKQIIFDSRRLFL